jgi:hypothetical protein
VFLLFVREYVENQAHFFPVRSDFCGRTLQSYAVKMTAFWQHCHRWRAARAPAVAVETAGLVSGLGITPIEVGSEIVSSINSLTH